MLKTKGSRKKGFPEPVMGRVTIKEMGDYQESHRAY